MSSPSFPNLRPLSMGELIDRAASFWRAHRGPLFRLYFGFSLVSFIAVRAFSAVIAHWFPLLRGGPAMQRALQADPTGSMRALILGGLAFTGLLLVSIWISWLAEVSASYFTFGRSLGREATIPECLSRALGKMPAVSLALAIACLWGCLVGVLAMVPGAALVAVASIWSKSRVLTLTLVIIGGVLTVLGAVGAGLWWVLRFCLTATVIGIEALGARGALRRSGQLVSGRLGPRTLDWVKLRAAIMLTVAMTILLTVLIVSGLPALIVQIVYGHIFNPSLANQDAIPQALLIPAELLQVAAQGFFSPFYVVFISLFYLDLRIRKEGLDLELQLSDPNP